MVSLILLSLIIYECLSTLSPTPNPTTAAPTSAPSLSYNEEEDHCKAGFDKVGSTYDLCPLTLGSNGQIHYYKVQDARNLTDHNGDSYKYEYYFNVGASLRTIPPICENSVNYTHRYCPIGADCTTDNNLIDITENVWAYQVRTGSTSVPDSCWAIGQGPPEWRVIDEEDTSNGVQLTYNMGDYDTSCHSNRQFNIQFVCEDNILFVPEEEPAYEHSPCSYTLAVPSQYGCPIECGVFDNKVCGGQGLCGYDYTNDASRCFCYNKYSGDDCATYDENADVPDESQVPSSFSTFYCTMTKGCAYSAEDVQNEGDVLVAYDLQQFSSSDSAAGQNGGVYIVEDKDYDVDTNRKWTYYVAIANVLNPAASDSILPDSCKSIPGPCDPTKEDCNNNNTGSTTGFVYQVSDTGDECWLLGSGFPSADLYDKIDDPAKGITITYDQGSYCEATKHNRKLKVNLVCPRDNTAVFDPFEETQVVEEYVEEEDTCVYAFTMESAIACPYQCITNTTDSENKEAFTVCSQKGVCAADPNAGFVRCLCDSGFTGVYCEQIDSPQPTVQPTIAPTVGEASEGGFVVTIVILIIVILVVVGVGYFIWRNQKMKIQEQQTELDFIKLGDENDKETLTTDSKGKTQFATIQQVDNDEGNDD